ncbi:hypothetical protein SKAU_G00284250 [Synaphobranchus kaupii]|uniref:Uncharacterized protein n=1 Tax=Synaphobranchus kaupii TaxID=118154 RepID=A0A9Q1EXX1_SYNKA|nr:hypothetical protein SKAU_G00284250 [Synaphobranchus kaupii]
MIMQMRNTLQDVERLLLNNAVKGYSEETSVSWINHSMHPAHPVAEAWHRCCIKVISSVQVQQYLDSDWIAELHLGPDWTVDK